MPQSSVDIPVSVLVFVWMVLAVILIAQLPLSRFTKKTAPLEAFQDKLGLSGLNAGIFFLVALFWVALFALLFGGLVKLIWSFIWDPLPSATQIWDWRFALAKLTALTGVLAAVVALPFTLIKISLSSRQTRTSEEKLALETIGLFEQRLQNALLNLSAQYVFKGLGRNISAKAVPARYSYFQWHSDPDPIASEDASRYSDWTTCEQSRPDVELRVAGVSQMEGIAHEYPKQARRIRSLLAGYLRQNAAVKTPPQSPRRYYAENSQGAYNDQQVFDQHNVWPDIGDAENVREWAAGLKSRDDLGQAMLVLGRLGKAEKNPDFHDAIAATENQPPLNRDFSSLNFQGLKLDVGAFKSSSFEYSRFEGSALLDTSFHGCNFRSVLFDVSTSLFCEFEHCDLHYSEWILADWQRTKFRFCKIKSAEFVEATLINNTFWETNLNYATFRQCTLGEVHFRGGSFVSTTFKYSYLSSCTFENAETLGMAKFYRVGLRDIDLTDTSIEQKQIDNCFGDNSIRLPRQIHRPSNWPDWVMPPDLHEQEWKKWRSNPSRYRPPAILGETDPTPTLGNPP